MKHFAQHKGFEFFNMPSNTSVKGNFPIWEFRNFFLSHRHLHYDDVIKICLNISDPTPITYQQL